MSGASCKVVLDICRSILWFTDYQKFTKNCDFSRPQTQPEQTTANRIRLRPVWCSDTLHKTTTTLQWQLALRADMQAQKRGRRLFDVFWRIPTSICGLQRCSLVCLGDAQWQQRPQHCMTWNKNWQLNTRRTGLTQNLVLIIYKPNIELFRHHELIFWCKVKNQMLEKKASGLSHLWSRFSSEQKFNREHFKNTSRNSGAGMDNWWPVGRMTSETMKTPPPNC